MKRLLAVESYDEPTDIVIHVNMLKEGWDVTNLYTIVPLRAASARTLIEQSIGRGLRLLYGRKTGVEPVDRLNIIAHDKFQEVVDEAGRGDSPIRLKVLKLDPAGGDGTSLKSVAVTPTINTILGIVAGGAGRAIADSSAEGGAPGHDRYPVNVRTTVLYTGEQTKVAQVALDVINELSRTRADLPTSSSLSQEIVQAEIVRIVQDRITPAQADLLPSEGQSSAATIEGIARGTVAAFIAHTIDIPRIQVLPKTTVQSSYAPFTLDVTKLNFQPQDQQLVSRGLQSATDVLYGRSSTIHEQRFEDYIVRELIGFDDVSYDQHAELIYGLAGQCVAHFRTYLWTDADMHSVLGNQSKAIADNVHAQMVSHYHEDIGEVEVIVRQGFTPLKPSAVTMEGEVLSLQQTPDDKSRIATMVYGGFARCAYDFAKFHSDTERILALILERDAQLWFRPVAGQFNIFYLDHAEYVPDFVATLADANLLIETKKAMDMGTAEVQAKAAAAVRWCAHASDHANRCGGRKWMYLLIPHDAVSVNQTLRSLAERYPG